MRSAYLVQYGQAQSAIVVGEGCPEFYHFIAGELQKYIRAISGVTLEIISAKDSEPLGARPITAISVGGPEVNPLSREALGRVSYNWNPLNLGPEGFVLKTCQWDESTVIVVVGSDEAGTMYAAYELLERYGVVFEITRDILPEAKDSLAVLELDVRIKPAFRYRGLQPFWNHMPGCQTWSLDQWQQFIDQCARLKFNYLAFHFFPFEPVLSYSYRGEPKLVGDISAKETGYMWRKRFPGSWGTSDIQVGREHFPYDRLCAPELLHVSGPEEAFAKAQEKLRQIIHYAKSRKIACAVSLYLQALPPNIARHVRTTLPDPWEHAVGKFVCCTDPRVHEINEIRFRSLVETYPEADAYWIYRCEGNPVCECEECRALYERERPNYADLPLDKQGERIDVRTDIAYIYALQKLLQIAKSIKPDAKLCAASICHEYMIPYLDRVLPEGVSIEALSSGAVGWIDRPMVENFDAGPGRELIVTHRIDDDAGFVGLQFNIGHFYKDHVLDVGAERGIAGQVWQVNRTRGMEHNVRYLNEACWNPYLLPDQFYQSYVNRVFGPDCAQEVLTAYHLLEEMEAYLGYMQRMNFAACVGFYLNVLPLLARQEEPHLGPSIANWASFVNRCKEDIVYFRRSIEYLDEALAHLGIALGSVRPRARSKLEYMISKSEAYRRHLQTVLALDEAYVTYDAAFKAKAAGDEAAFLAELRACQALMSRVTARAVETASKWAEFIDHPCDLAVLFAINKMIINGSTEISKLVCNTVNFWHGRPYWEKVDYERIFPWMPTHVHLTIY